MTLLKDNTCFVCGKENKDGMHIKVELDEEQLQARTVLKVNDKYNGWMGITHGGIISTLLDEMSVYAAGQGKKHVVTAELSVKFKKPLPTEKLVTFEAKVDTVRHPIITVNAKAYDENNVYATSKAKIFHVVEK